MEKEFVPYEQALDLKELGFDEKCLGYYHNKELSFGPRTSYGEVIEAPTFSQAFRWFREKYNIHHTIYLLIENPKVYEGSLKNNLGSIVFMKESTTYEKTELECLKKLIEIVKQK